MTNPKGYVTISAVLFAGVALVHLVRAIAAWPIVIGHWSVPLELSWLAAAATGALCAWAIALLCTRT
jgi:hypothetical protein